MKTKTFLWIAIAILLTACTVRGIDTSLIPILQSNGEIIYRYGDIAGLSLQDGDKDAEDKRLRDMNDWVVESGICSNGYTVLRRQAILLRQGSPGKKIYYFIKCK